MIRSCFSLVLAAALALLLAACGGGGGEAGGKTEVVVWHGYADAQGDNFTALIDQYNQAHPDVNVTQLVTNSDLVLQKILTAVRGGTPPDVAYMFGSWSPNIAQIPRGRRHEGPCGAVLAGTGRISIRASGPPRPSGTR
ncbi:MAG: extracellular solute-binding protein [Mycobacterium sp.]|nr:extracellular solute-binding protein [Mycobacterium sp.]